MRVPDTTRTSRQPNLDVEDGVEYPSSDGKPMGETEPTCGWPWSAFFWGLDPLLPERPQRSRCTATCFMYYAQGDPRRKTRPDAFVAREVDKDPDRRSYKVWKEGKGPDVASKSP